MRLEKDALGELHLPDDSYYGIQTERARQNFAVSGQTLDDFPVYIRCVAAIKKAAALANSKTGVLSQAICAAICAAADEIMSGQMKGQFPVDIFQGGGGTSINMNVNEVLANRANEILTGQKGYEQVHPNTHVNLCQSTNDVIPSAMRMTCHFDLQKLIAAIEMLEKTLEQKKASFDSVVRLGRTCLQDAVPVTLGQTFSSYLDAVKRHKSYLEKHMAACLEIPLGATAVGTGIGVLPGYMDHVYPFLREVCGINVKKDKNFFDSLQNGDYAIRISGELKALASSLSKMATDFRILSSGPRAGLAEIELPAVQPGSSIMPGKVNPVMPELVNQVCYQVCGNDFAITMAAEGAELELNVWEPVTSKCLFESIRLLTGSIRLFSEKCIAGIKANPEQCSRYAASSLSLSTVIAALYDYQTGCQVARFAAEQQINIKEASVQLNLLTQAEADELLDPMLLTDPEKSCTRTQAIAEKRKNK